MVEDKTSATVIAVHLSTGEAWAPSGCLGGIDIVNLEEIGAVDIQAT
jgi:hypothetical protein